VHVAEKALEYGLKRDCDLDIWDGARRERGRRVETKCFAIVTSKKVGDEVVREGGRCLGNEEDRLILDIQIDTADTRHRICSSPGIRTSNRESNPQRGDEIWR
jgi:hypothetical protein